MVHAVVHNADHKEHARRDDAVGDHLEHGAIHAHLPIVRVEPIACDGAPHTQPQHDVTHVAHRAVGDQPLEVGLGHRGECPVDHAHHADAAHDIRQVVAGLRTNWITNTEDAVAAHL